MRCGGSLGIVRVLPEPIGFAGRINNREGNRGGGRPAPLGCLLVLLNFLQRNDKHNRVRSAYSRSGVTVGAVAQVGGDYYTPLASYFHGAYPFGESLDQSAEIEGYVRAAVELVARFQEPGIVDNHIGVG